MLRKTVRSIDSNTTQKEIALKLIPIKTIETYHWGGPYFRPTVAQALAQRPIDLTEQQIYFTVEEMKPEEMMQTVSYPNPLLTVMLIKRAKTTFYREKTIL